MQDDLKILINKLNNEFEATIGGTYVKLDTGELFTQIEVNKYISRRLEEFSQKQLRDIKETSNKIFGVEPEQVLINKRSKKPKLKNKAKFDNGDFNMVYKNQNVLMELMNMKLEVNEKLVFYVLRDFISFPDNSVLINGEVPAMKDLEPIIGLKERTIRKALKGLEQKGLVKLKRSGVRKCIFYNPYYIASGREISISTLKMFELLQCDDNKIEQYINKNK